MLYLEVPYAEKDEAKKLGAKWNAQEKKWYVPDGVDESLFKEWIPVTTTTEYNLEAKSPFYLVKSQEICWKCTKRTEVVCFASNGVNDYEDGDYEFFITYSMITLVPSDLAQFIRDHLKLFHLDYSKTAHCSYYMNHCEHCSTGLGDYFMHNSPEGAFFPVTEQQALDMKLIKLEFTGRIPLEASPIIQQPSYIEDFAARASFK